MAVTTRPVATSGISKYPSLNSSVLVLVLLLLPIQASAGRVVVGVVWVAVSAAMPFGLIAV